jgi:hypothetical protein
MTEPSAQAPPQPVSDVHGDYLRLGPVRIADPPIPYRAYQVGRWRFGWSGEGIRFRLSTMMIPSHFALTFELMPNGDWRLREMKPLETNGEARSWAESLWRQAAARSASGR